MVVSLIDEDRIKEILKKPVAKLTDEDKKLLREWYIKHRSRRSIAMDLRYRSKRTPKYVKTWVRHPERYDIPGVDTPEALAQLEKLGYKPGRRRKQENINEMIKKIANTLKDIIGNMSIFKIDEFRVIDKKGEESIMFSYYDRDSHDKVTIYINIMHDGKPYMMVFPKPRKDYGYLAPFPIYFNSLEELYNELIKPSSNIRRLITNPATVYLISAIYTNLRETGEPPKEIPLKRAIEKLQEYHIPILDKVKQKEKLEAEHKPTAVESKESVKFKELSKKVVETVFQFPNILDKDLRFAVFPNGRIVKTYDYHRKLGINGEYGELISGFNIEPHYKLRVPVGTILVVTKNTSEKEPVHGLTINKPVPEYYYVDENGKIHKIDTYETEEKVLEQEGDSKLVLEYHVIRTPYREIKIPYKLYGTGKYAYNINMVYYPVLYHKAIRNALEKFRKASKNDIINVTEAYKGMAIYPSTEEAKEKIIKDLDKHGIRYHFSKEHEWRTNRYSIYIYIPEYELYRNGKKIAEILSRHGANKHEIEELINNIIKYDVPFYKIAEHMLKRNINSKILKKLKIKDIDLFKSRNETSVTIRLQGYNKLSKEEKDALKQHHNINIVDRKGEREINITYLLPYSDIEDVPIGTWLRVMEPEKFEKLYRDITRRGHNIGKNELEDLLNHVEERLKEYKSFYKYLLRGEYDKITRIVDRKKDMLFYYYDKNYNSRVLDDKSVEEILNTIYGKYKEVIEKLKENPLIRKIINNKQLLETTAHLIDEYSGYKGLMKELLTVVSDTNTMQDMIMDPAKVIAIVDSSSVKKYFGNSLKNVHVIPINKIKKVKEGYNEYYVIPDGTRYYSDYIEPILKLRPDKIMAGKGMPLFAWKNNVVIVVAPQPD